RLVRMILWGVMALTIVAVLGTYSRGGFLALGITLCFMLLKGRNRIITGSFLVAIMAIALLASPAQWQGRMQAITTYQQDESAEGRLSTWKFAWNRVTDHPLVGGGFRVFYDEGDVFFRYAPPEATRARNAHSIYFEVLGETGFVGLALFLWLGIAAF